MAHSFVWADLTMWAQLNSPTVHQHYTWLTAISFLWNFFKWSKNSHLFLLFKKVKFAPSQSILNHILFLEFMIFYLDNSRWIYEDFVTFTIILMIFISITLYLKLWKVIKIVHAVWKSLVNWNKLNNNRHSIIMNKLIYVFISSLSVYMYNKFSDWHFCWHW